MVINLDIKTLDKEGNEGDIKNLQFENNQSSFENKNQDIVEEIPGSGIKVECLLPKEYRLNQTTKLPVLTFFLTIIYQDDKHSFKLCDDDNLQTVWLKCLPNGFLSPLFNYDLVDNFKTYDYFKSSDNPIFAPVYLTDNKTEVNQKINEFILQNPDYVLINGRTKVGAYNQNQIHPKYNTGVSWFPVERKDEHNGAIKHYMLEAVKKGNTNRTSNDKLTVRYDSNDKIWYGVKKLKI